MLKKICSQVITKLFYITSDNKYSYEAIVEKYPDYCDASISVDKGCTVHVEITQIGTSFKRNFDYIAKTFNANQMVSKSQRYFNQYGLIPNPRLKFFKDEL